MDRRFPSLVAGLLFTTGLPIALLAQDAPWQPWAWVQDSVHSTGLGATRQLRIALPSGYTREDAAGDRYPVLILAGADDGMAFSAMLTNLRLLEGPLGGAVPPLIVVGVMSGSGPAQDWYPAGSTSGRFRKQDSRAEAVGEFLATELVPWIRDHFRTLPYTVIAGHSAPGHFAVHAFARFPEAFQAAVAVSPAFWWVSPEANDDSLSQADAALVARRRQPGRLFITVGGYDPVNIRIGVEHLVAALDAPMPGTTIHHQVLPDDNHQTARQQGFIDGLRWVFRPVSLSQNQVYAMMKPFGVMDSAALVGAFQEAGTSYAVGARLLGLPPSLPESYLWETASLSPIIARTVCEDYLAGYPDKPRAHACLGDALLAAADSLNARTHYTRGLELARQLGQSTTTRWLEQRLARLGSPSPPGNP